jgi:hypothetical protein
MWARRRDALARPRGWKVTAVDLSAGSLSYGRSIAEAAGADIAERIDCLRVDLGGWTQKSGHYHLVVCFYVHIADSETGLVKRLATGVAMGGTLLLVGHRTLHPSTGAATPVANQVQVSVSVRLMLWIRNCGRWLSPRSAIARSRVPESMQ